MYVITGSGGRKRDKNTFNANSKLNSNYTISDTDASDIKEVLDIFFEFLCLFFLSQCFNG